MRQALPIVIVACCSPPPSSMSLRPSKQSPPDAIFITQRPSASLSGAQRHEEFSN